VQCISYSERCETRTRFIVIAFQLRFRTCYQEGPKKKLERVGTKLYTSPNIIKVIMSRRMRWAGHVECMRKMRKTYKILARKPEGKKPCGRSRRWWEDNIRMDLREIGWEVVDWIHRAEHRDRWRAAVNTVMNFGFHKRRAVSWLNERLLASQGGLCSMELVVSF
jgi:hypothetical protein